VLKTEELATLIRFREELYNSMGLRQDSLFELVDAGLTSPHRSTLVRLSLTAAFRRLWPSTCDALGDGSVDVPALRTLFVRTLADAATVDGRALWVIDGTHWARPAARTSPGRMWEYRPLRGRPQSGIGPGLGLSMVGGRARRGCQLGIAAGRAAARAHGRVGDQGRARADRDHAGSATCGCCTSGGHAG